jgi:hypothetical protein
MDTKKTVTGPLRGHVFKVEHPDLGTSAVTLHVRADGVIERILNGEALLPLIETARHQHRSSLANQLSRDPVTGITRVENPDGSISPIVSDKTKRDMHFFLERQPCWFEGCTELMAAYRAEVAEAAQDPDCPPCVEGAIMRKYLKKLANVDTGGLIPQRLPSLAPPL